MRNVFVSYSHKDVILCKSICTAISSTGKTNVWYDQGLIPGDIYRKTIAKEIMKADCFIVLISSNSINSEWVLDELEFAKNQKKRIIPIWLESIALPEEIELILLRHHGLFYYQYQEDAVLAGDILSILDERIGTEEWQEDFQAFKSEWSESESLILNLLEIEKKQLYSQCYQADNALLLGKIYYMGLGTAQDLKRASFYFTVSAYMGNIDAQFYLLQMEIEECQEDNPSSERIKALNSRIAELAERGSIPAKLFFGEYLLVWKVSLSH